MEKSKQFGSKLKTYRKHAGLTQAQLATMADISIQMIKDIEAGRRNGSYATIEKLLGVLREHEHLRVKSDVADVVQIAILKKASLMRVMALVPDFIFEAVQKYPADHKVWETVKHILGYAEKPKTVSDDEKKKGSTR